MTKKFIDSLQLLLEQINNFPDPTSKINYYNALADLARQISINYSKSSDEYTTFDKLFDNIAFKLQKDIKELKSRNHFIVPNS